MDEFIGYIVKSGTSLVILYFFYWLLLRKDTHFRLNRSVLLFSIASSLVVPFINIYFFANQHIKEDLPVFYATINEVVIKATSPTTVNIGKSTDWWHIIAILYGLGALIVLGRLIYQGIYLHVMTKLSKTIQKGKFTIVVMNAEITPFAYFNKVFIPASKADNFSIETIMAHERAHQQQYHFIDLFLMQLVTVIQWFNPIVWLYERSLKETHEYLADETVLKNGQNKGVYQALLVNEAMGGPVFSLTNQFNQSLIKKRIIMMTKMRSSRLTQLKVLLVFPLMLFILFAFANPNVVVKPVINKGKELLKMEEQLVNPTKDALMVETGNQNAGITKDTTGKASSVQNSVDDGPFTYVDVLPEYPGGMDSLMRFLSRNIKYPAEAIEKNVTGRVFVQFIIDKQGIAGNPKIIKGIGAGCDDEAIRVIKLFPKWKPGMKDGKTVSVYFTLPIAFSLNDEKKGQIKNGLEGVKLEQGGNDNPGEDAPLMFVEQMPEYPGGIDAMMKFLATNIKYPPEALKYSITGKVILQFVIDSKGKVNNIKVLRGIGGGCNEEAVRVVKSFPDWKPGKDKGKPVSVYFTLPIIFNLKS